MRVLSTLWAGTCLLAILSLPTKSALGSVITVSPGDVTKGDTAGCSLIDAITAANENTTTNTTVGGCVPAGTPNGGDGDTYTTGTVVKLAAGTYTLTQVNNSWYGANGLPAIATDITIVGDPDGSVIERSTAAGTPTFRFFFVGGGQSLSGYNPPAGAPANLPGPGKLTLVSLTLEHGLFRGGDGAAGGGGSAGLGGAIYNQGMLKLDGVTLAFNEAVGGDADSGTLGGGGGLYNSADSSGKGGSGGIAGNGGASTPTVIGSDGGNGGIGGGGGSGALTGAGGTGGYGGGGGYGDYRGGDGGFGGGGGGSQIHPAVSYFGGGTGGVNHGGGGAGFGGAIFNEGGTVSLLNSTITGNSVHGGQGNSVGVGYGAALFNLNGTVTIRYSTLANNSVDGRITIGGAVYNLYLNPVGSPAADAGMAATVTVNSSILANSLQGTTLVSDCENNAGTFTGGYDVVQTDASPRCSFVNNDQAADPHLAPLTDNGGPTQTLALASTSPAVDMGDTDTALGAIPAVDQRGFPRDSQPDAGAYELIHEPTVKGLVDVTATVGAAIPAQDFTLTGTGALTISVSSSNDDLLPTSGVAPSADCGTDNAHRDCALTLKPASGQVGTATITVTADDSYGNSGEQSFAVTVTDVAPTAASASISTPSGTAASGVLEASDPDTAQTLTFSIAGQPAHGTVTLDAGSGAFTYTPAAGYVGNDSFAYTVSDGYETSTAAVVNITITAANTGDTGSNDTGDSGSGNTGDTKPPPSLDLSGGGGEFGFLGLGLLGLALLRKRRRV